MRKRPLPEKTTLDHAVRWIQDRTPVLSPEDRIAIGDELNVEGEWFEEERKALLLSLRDGAIDSEAYLNFFSSNHARFNEMEHFTYASHLKYFFPESVEEALTSQSGANYDLAPIPLPPEIWSDAIVNWETSWLEFEGDEVRGFTSNVLLCTEQLMQVFPAKEEPASIMLDDPKGSSTLTDIERGSLLKLVATMAVKGYSYDPKATRSKSISEIRDDMLFLGLDVDAKTIRKWLKEASLLLPAGDSERE